MNEYSLESSSSTRTNLPVNTFAEIENTWPDNESPALVSETVVRRVEREGFDIIRINRVTHKAPSGMRVQGNHEKESQMMRVPEGLETLITDLLVRS